MAQQVNDMNKLTQEAAQKYWSSSEVGRFRNPLFKNLETIYDYQGKIINLSEEIEELENENRDLADGIILRDKDEIESLRADVEELENENSDLKDVINKFEKEMEEMVEKIIAVTKKYL